MARQATAVLSGGRWSGTAAGRPRRAARYGLLHLAVAAATFAALGAALLLAAACGVQAFTLSRSWQASAAATRRPGRRRGPEVALAAESFDPFGWKGKFKDTIMGLMDGLSDDEPSKIEEQMMLDIFQKFDVDRDGILNLQEFNTLQVATEGEEATYNQEQLTSLLLAVNSEIEEPERGMPFADYRRLYVVRRLRQAYNTDVNRDYAKIFGSEGAAQAAAAVKAKEELLTLGATVRIAGLMGAVELNGQEGHIVAPVEAESEMVAEGRVIVKLADGERVALKPANVQVISSS